MLYQGRIKKNIHPSYLKDLKLKPGEKVYIFPETYKDDGEIKTIGVISQNGKLDDRIVCIPFIFLVLEKVTLKSFQKYYKISKPQKKELIIWKENFLSSNF